MIDMLLYDGDLIADKNGDILLCASESDDVIQTANNNILLRFGDNKFHNNLGNKIYNRRIKANQSGLETVQAECINAVATGDSRIREIKQMVVTLGENASCIVDYVLVYAKTNDINIYDEELIEVDGRAFVNAFNMEGGE